MSLDPNRHPIYDLRLAAIMSMLEIEAEEDHQFSAEITINTMLDVCQELRTLRDQLATLIRDIENMPDHSFTDDFYQVAIRLKEIAGMPLQ